MKKIAVMPNIQKDIGLVYAKKIVDFLSGKAELYMEKRYQSSNLPVIFSEQNIFDIADVVIVLGGDGTILKVAESCAKCGVPILGVNLGTIGFMSEVEIEHIENAMERLLSDDYIIQSRMMMQVEIYKNNFLQGKYHALNDVVISKYIESKLTHIKLYSDDELVNTYKADGMIIATPTGSTAYSLAAGGPVVDPLMELFIATPVCPHMLTARAAIMSAEKTITLHFHENYLYEAAVCVDGEVQAHIKYGDKVVITKSNYATKLIKIHNRSFYDTLIMKLS
ncbi:MAG: NAD(+)/NADH kinase [Clostridia bacterium]|nr:NAD(+)/NADH kinase [Clostridia bacterium]